MDATQNGPVELPGWAWQDAEVRAALQTRDVSRLLQLAQQFAGTSQARLARAFGMGQGRVNEFINRRRQVTQLEVFERIADGLTMPDDARALLGLAPARAAASGILTGHAEIARIYAGQAEIETMVLRHHATEAAQIDVLAVRGLGLIALNDSTLRGPLTRRQTSAVARVLLLDPDSPAATVRAAEIGESSDSFAAGIRLALVRLAEFADHPHLHLEVRLYDALPTWRMLSFDHTLYLSAFGVAWEGHRSGVYKLTAAADGVLHAGFRRHFDDMWRRARHPGTEGP